MSAAPPIPRNHLYGSLLVLLSAALFAMAGVFTKLVTAGPLAISGWRGFVGAILVAAYAYWRRRSVGEPFSIRLGRQGWIIAALSAMCSTLYIAAFKLTYVANVAVIYAIAPFVAAGLARVFVNEPVRPLTIVTAVISLAGVLVIVANGLGSGNMLGDIFALAMTIAFAMYMVAVRAFQQAPVLWSVAVSAFCIFLFAAVFGDLGSTSWHDLGILLLFGLTFSSGVIVFTEGARLLPVAETALIGTMDVPFAVAFAWIFINEVPPVITIVGGLVVIAALVVQALGDLAGARWQQWRGVRGRATPTPPVSGGGDS